MTVCIAALCQSNNRDMIFATADRMLTAEDIKFEPPRTKVYYINNSIIALTAGNTNYQNEILTKVINFARTESNNPPEIKDVVRAYIEFYNSIRLFRSENTILAPFGLNHQSFISQQRNMIPAFVKSISNELRNFYVPTIATIIAGVDESGTHIYKIIQEEAVCMDSIGFASIGVGRRHAESQFMLARHTRFSAWQDALLLTYSAKKRAEVAPGVGTDTDMYSIGPGLGTVSFVPSDLLIKIDEVYKSVIENEEKIKQKAQEQARICADQFVQGLLEKTPPHAEIHDENVD